AKLHQKLQSTMIYVTHDQVEAMTLADRIVVLEYGKIAQVGTPKELYQRPANLFVAQFIGSPKMNILPLNAQAGKLRKTDGLQIPEGAISLGVRPEHIGLTGPDGGHCAGEIEV